MNNEIMDTIFNQKISDLEGAKFFIEVLVTNELSFHFEEDAQNIIDLNDNKPTFSVDDANSINDRLDEMYNLDWSGEGCDCPIGYELDCLKAFDLDDDNIKNKCFCDYCDDFVETSECTVIDIDITSRNNDFEVACSTCYKELYKNK